MIQSSTPNLQDWNTFSKKTLDFASSRANKFQTNERQGLISFSFTPIQFYKIPNTVDYPEDILEYFTQEYDVRRSQMRPMLEGQGMTFSLNSIHQTEICHVKFHINGVVTGRSVFDFRLENGMNGYYKLLNGFELLAKDLEKFWVDNEIEGPTLFAFEITEIAEQLSNQIGVSGNFLSPEESLFLPGSTEPKETAKLIDTYFKSKMDGRFTQ